ncbi:hypothetical protein [Kitasatospora sp. NBC_01539]|uniref:hypothetical protein n=1 Tax=Kitasatospora sp. NBC_01539 TaxID=2903577 RepID=UPI00386020A8
MEPTPTPRSARTGAAPQSTGSPATGSRSAEARAGNGAGPSRPGRATRFRNWILGTSMSAVIFLVSLSLGLLMCMVQVTSNWMTAFCSLVWAITAVALLGRFFGQRAMNTYRMA